MLKITEIKKEAMPTSVWSGGTTTEILIWPRGAVYAERDFLFRASTAKVELEESDFTPLPDYDRFIASIEGSMVLTHSAPDGGETAEVLPLSTVHRFSGGVPTHCVGKARDLNLMLRKGKAEGELRFIKKDEFVALPLPAGEFAIVYDTETGDAKLALADEDDFLAFSAEHISALFTVREIKNS
ncbi:MAG: HutD family protein [Clostridia bacterium]|nr:HutD family protein [Clostridia bacterium]